MIEIRVNEFNQYGWFFKALGGKQSPFFAGAKICFFIDVSVSHNQGLFFIKKKQGVSGALKRFSRQFVNGVSEILKRRAKIQFFASTLIKTKPAQNKIIFINQSGIGCKNHVRKFWFLVGEITANHLLN